MNVYDFDGTIFYSDCSIGFALWCMKRKPKLWFTWLPHMIKTLILYKQGKIQNYRLQREMFSYLTLIDDFDEQIEKYWDKYEGKISAWYLAQKREDDLMYAREKAKYMIDRGFPVMENFYSDSLADTPLALCAEHAHLVTNKATTVVDWQHLDPETMKKVKEKIDTGWEIHLK